MAMNELEWRLRHLEELSHLLAEQARVLKAGIGKLMQDEEMFMQGPLEGGTPPVTSFSGSVKGCGGKVMPFASVNISDASTQALIWSGTADGSGAYSGTLTPPSGGVVTPSASAGSSTPFGSRFTGSWSGQNVNVNAGSTVVIPDLLSSTSNVASGYICTPEVYYPLANTNHLTDSMNGTWTLTRSLGAWTQTKGLTYPGCGACPSSGTLNVQLQLFASDGHIAITYLASGTCPSAFGATNVTKTFTPVWTITSQNPFQADADVTFTSASNPWYCNRTVHFTWTE